MHKIIYTNSYEKKTKKFLKKHPELIDKYSKIITILENDYKRPSLRFHKLSGKSQDFYSISIDMSYQVVIEFVIKNNEIIPINIGIHSDAYY